MLVPHEMAERRVVRGVLGCPECQAEFPIAEGVADLRLTPADSPRRLSPPPLPAAYDVTALQSFIGLDGAGGYILLAGTAARHAAALADATPGVHIVAINAPLGTAPAAMVSVLRADAGLPFKGRHLRAVVLGADHADAVWVSEAVRVLLPGLRLVVENDAAHAEGVTELARGAGLFVAEKT